MSSKTTTRGPLGLESAARNPANIRSRDSPVLEQPLQFAADRVRDVEQRPKRPGSGKRIAGTHKYAGTTGEAATELLHEHRLAGAGLTA